VFGLAFTLAGAVIMLAERTSVDIGPLWGFAVVSIAVGVVTLLVTIARSRHEPVESSLPAASVASRDPGEDLGDG
jgi:hypothetical protein